MSTSKENKRSQTAHCGGNLLAVLYAFAVLIGCGDPSGLLDDGHELSTHARQATQPDFEANAVARAAHPQVLVGPADREAIKRKLEQVDWAKAGYAQLRKRIDPLVERTKREPDFMTSRLLLNWDTHYTTPRVHKSRLVGGEGRAPVPTPRFAGARDWNSIYGRPDRIEDWRPYNDLNGKIHLKNNKTRQLEWVDPAQTGHTIESTHQLMMEYAADAAFVYWLTGDEAYARFATSILWPFMEGFAHTTAPKPVEPDEKMMSIIGVTSFEVIHEGVAMRISLAYDFLYDYLVAQGKDVRIIQDGLRRFAQRVTDGGGREGNWNLHQAMVITYVALALEDDAAYADRRGRQFFVNVVLNADLPNQKGLTRVIEEGFDPQSALWPEAPNYGFGSVAQLVELASLLSNDPAGRRLLENPLLARSVITQAQLLHPNGRSIGLGDTSNTRLSARALEGLIAFARGTNNAELEKQLTPVLLREIAARDHNRSALRDLYSLTRFVPELREGAVAPEASRTFYADGLNVLMQRNVVTTREGAVDPTYSLAAALFGTNGGHVHANGLAMELFGAGYILGADPGRGASYWIPEHRDYYVTPVAHNTVIVNGQSNYHEYNDPHKKMRLLRVEPAPGEAASSRNISVATAAFRYARPASEQRRTLALIRTGPKSGFYFDVFRSRADWSQGEFHDYLYHNMGQSLSLTGADGKPLNLSPTSSLVPRSGLMKAYRYLQNERSATIHDGMHAGFTLELPGGKKPSMALWMPGGGKRTVFAVDAPQNNAIRDDLPAPLRALPMPTIVVRQQGQAWDRPFVAVYEPFIEAEGATLESVRSIELKGAIASVVNGRDHSGKAFTVYLLESDSDRTFNVEGLKMSGPFSAVILHDGAVVETYPVRR